MAKIVISQLSPTASVGPSNAMRSGVRLNDLPLLPENHRQFTPAGIPGWKDSTRGIIDFDHLPATAQSYLHAVEGLTGAPIHMISTGPDRNENIILKHPLD